MKVRGMVFKQRATRNLFGRAIRLAGTAVAVVAAGGCSTVLVSHVAGNDFTTPGVRYYMPAPYLLVKAPVEISRIETLYSLSPIERTMLRPVVPCDDGQTACSQPDRGGVGSHPGVPAVGAQTTHHDASGGSQSGDGHDRHHESGNPPATIVWLPDYCQQYTIHEKNHAGSQKVQIQLAEGWKLTSLNTENNNTEVLQKMFDTLSSVAGKAADSSYMAPTSLAGAAARVVTTGAQSAQTRLFRRTRVLTFKPGLYQLLEYPRNKDNELDCTKLPSFHPPKDATHHSELWSEVFSPPTSISIVNETATSVPAAPVDPGRPATVARPPLR